MDKKYTVFVSSTYLDLRKERQEAVLAILEKGWFPIGMEYFTADPRKLNVVINEHLDQTDFYLLIVKGRYGTIFNSESYTEYEYNIASKRGIPILAFIHSNTAKVRDKQEDENKYISLNRFIERVSKDVSVNRWNNKDILHSKISTTLSKINVSTVKGWSRGDGLKEIINESSINEIEKSLSKKIKLSYFYEKLDAENRFIVVGNPNNFINISLSECLSLFGNKLYNSFTLNMANHVIKNHIEKSIYDGQDTNMNEAIIKTNNDDIMSIFFEIENLALIKRVNCPATSNSPICWSFTKMGDNYYKKTIMSKSLEGNTLDR